MTQDDTTPADCIFCKIIAGEIPSTKISEDEHTLAFLDIKPINPGHTLVIPKTHHIDLLNTPSDVVMHIILTAQRVGKALLAGIDAEGVNMNTNVRAAAGQDVFHTHIHIIPRYSDDNLKHWVRGEYVSHNEQQKIADAIITTLTNI